MHNSTEWEFRPHNRNYNKSIDANLSIFNQTLPYVLEIWCNNILNQESWKKEKDKKKTCWKEGKGEKSFTLCFLLNDDSPEKNFISGCVRCKSRSICRAISVCWKNWIHYIKQKLNYTIKYKWWLMPYNKRCTSKYWCQTLALPRLKGWSSWEISWRVSGPSTSLSVLLSSLEFNASSFILASSD